MASYSEVVQGEEASDCVAKLTSLLENAFAGGKGAEEPSSSPVYTCLLCDPPLYALSASLLHGLLQENPIFTPALEELLSFVNQHAARISLVLEAISLRCLARYLLKSRVEPGLERGLYLLLNEPEYITDSGSMKFQLSIPKSGNHLQLVQKRMAHDIYHVFTDETVNARVRRMAGKSLADILYNSGECELLGELDNDHSFRPLVTTLHAMDIVVSFFASAIILALQKSGTNGTPEWGLGKPRLNYTQPHRNALDQFYRYARAGGHYPSHDAGGQYKLDDANGVSSVCYLLRSDGTTGLPEGPVLLALSSDSINFINCRRVATGWHFEYTAVRPKLRTRTTCIFSSQTGQSPVLSLNIDANDSTVTNDQRRNLQNLNLNIVSDEDIAEIQKRLEAMGVQCQIGNPDANLITRRWSSLVIELDTNDEVLRNSSQPSQSPSLTAVNHPPVKRGQVGNEPSAMLGPSDTNFEPSSKSQSQSSLTELTRTPTVYQTSSPKDQSCASPIITRDFAEDQSTEKKIERVPEVPIEPSSKREEMNISCLEDTHAIDNNQQHNGMQTVRFQEEPSANSHSTIIQEEDKATTNTKLKPILTNTQESLIFPRRRSRGKLYTAPSKKTVDWDEDLRKSDNSVEREAHKDAELTSVSSPSPNEADCTFSRRSGLENPKRPTGRISASKARGRSKRGKAKSKELTNRKTKQSSHSGESIANNVCHDDKHTSKPREQNVEANRHGDCSSPRVEILNICNVPTSDASPIEDTSHLISRACHPQKKHDSNLQTATDGKLDGPKTAAASHSRIETGNSGSGNMSLRRSIDDQDIGQNNQGRGQTVGQKLTAAFREGLGTTPEDGLDETREKSPELGTGIGRESAGPHDVPASDEKSADDDLHKDHELQDLPESSAFNMSPQHIVNVEPYPIPSHDEGQNRSLRITRSMTSNLVTRKRAAASEADSEQERKKAKRALPSVTSSSVETRSTGSAFDSCYTSSQIQLKRRDVTLCESLEKCTSAVDVQAPGSGTERSDNMTTDDEDGEHLTALRSPSRIVSGREYRVTKCLESSSRTIVDKNGSPRLLHQGKKNRVTPKRGNPSPGADQPPTAKRRKLSIEVDDRDTDTQSHTEEYNVKENAHQPGDGADTGPKKNTSHILEKATGESSRTDGASHTAVSRNEGFPSLLDRLRTSREEGRVFKNSTSPSVRPSWTTQEACPADESKDHDPKSQQPPECKLPAVRADSVPTVAQKLAKDAALQSEWQVSLQELHKDMQSTLLSHSEHLSRQIESERTTINRVLESYRERCHKVLDQLLEAQRERIRLCKQQMDSIKQQHADVCQELISRLEEDERSLCAIHESQ